ncbi:MAG: hypothetical protein GTN99_09140 [Candidatus Dadabacteria bacterium]|nr:hypothetical protein [Candidatus Dadabacteria bacterium]
MKAKSAKAKGRRLEKYVHDQHKAAGVESRMQPGSGIYSAFPHDNHFVLPFIGPLIGECKARKSGITTIQRWLGKAEILFIKPDYQDPYVVMPWPTYKAFLDALVEIKEGEDGQNSPR